MKTLHNRQRISCCVAALGFSLALTLLSGCSNDPTKGYSFSSTFRSDVETVNVPMFGNTTYIHGLESELTSAVITEIHRQSQIRVVSAGSAQTTLSGTIVRSDMRKLSTGRDTGLVEEMALTLTVEFQWKDNRTNKVLVTRKDFSASESFVPARGAGESLELGQQAAISRLARDIVNEMRSNW